MITIKSINGLHYVDSSTVDYVRRMEGGSVTEGWRVLPHIQLKCVEEEDMGLFGSGPRSFYRHFFYVHEEALRKDLDRLMEAVESGTGRIALCDVANSKVRTGNEIFLDTDALLKGGDNADE